MYHDYGAEKWRINTPEEFVNFTKTANVTTIWISNEQQLGHQVVGNDIIAKELIGVEGESEQNVHIDFLVTKRIIGLPIEWKNQTQFQIILEENKQSAKRGEGLQRVPTSDWHKKHARATYQ